MVESTKLYCLFDDNATFRDLTLAVNDPIRESSTFDYTTAQDKLYLGRYKPFNAVWIQLNALNSVAATLTLKYWDGTAWTAITPDLEDTKGFTRSGWLRWTTPTDWVAVAVNSVTKFWVQITFNVTLTTTTTIQFIGVIFCDDQALKTELFNFDQTVPTADSAIGHFLRHIAARDDIMTRIKAAGYLKLDGHSGNPRPYNEWDLMDLDDVRQAAKHKALAKIYFNLSSVQDDSWMEKSRRAESAYETAIKSATLSLDQDEDGLESAGESATNLTVPRQTRF